MPVMRAARSQGDAMNRARRRDLEMSGVLQSTDVRFYRNAGFFARAEGRLLFAWARVAMVGDDSRSSRSIEQLTHGRWWFLRGAGRGRYDKPSHGCLSFRPGEHARQRI